MKKFKLTAHHYDMTPGTVVWQVGLGTDCYTVNKDNPREPYLRIVPQEKVEPVNES